MFRFSSMVSFLPTLLLVTFFSSWCVDNAESFSQKYLDSLSSLQYQQPEEPIQQQQQLSYEDIVPEEYYGLTNPMANSWPGSKHEKYGGYLHNLGTPSFLSSSSSRNLSSQKSPESPSTPFRSGSSYLSSLEG